MGRLAVAATLTLSLAGMATPAFGATSTHDAESAASQMHDDSAPSTASSADEPATADTAPANAAATDTAPPDTPATDAAATEATPAEALAPTAVSAQEAEQTAVVIENQAHPEEFSIDAQEALEKTNNESPALASDNEAPVVVDGVTQPTPIRPGFRTLPYLQATDDPVDDLRYHKQIKDDPDFDGEVRPTFRPDKYLEPAREDWPQLMKDLSEASGVDTTTWAGFNEAMANRRAYFKENGAISTDHSHRDPGTARLSDADAERIYKDALAGKVSQEDADALRRSMMYEQIRMATEDGLVMTLHPAVYSNHHTPTFEKYGADVGTDIPLKAEFANNLQPALADFGASENLHLIPFTMDETVYSRELAPLAGFYPSVFIGVPWWFIDAPDAIARFRSAITETAGFTRTSGFIDDTRAFLSIPARHDVARRVDSGYVARLVAEHRLDMDEAVEAIYELTVKNPIRVFKLGDVLGK